MSVISFFLYVLINKIYGSYVMLCYKHQCSFFSPVLQSDGHHKNTGIASDDMIIDDMLNYCHFAN